MAAFLAAATKTQNAIQIKAGEGGRPGRRELGRELGLGNNKANRAASKRKGFVLSLLLRQLLLRLQYEQQ